MQSCWPSKTVSLGIPSPSARSQGEEPDGGLEPSGQCKIFFSATVFQSVGHPSVGIGFNFVMLMLLLLSYCGFFFVRGDGLFFWRHPMSSFRWLFNSYLKFWCSHRARRVQIFLLRHENSGMCKY